MKFIKILLIILVFILLLVSCKEAMIASHNLSQEAEEFKIFRRVVFYNGITDTYMLTVEGYCSIESDNIDGQLELTVKLKDGRYLKHYLGLSDNVTYFVEQIEPEKVSNKHYEVIFRPSVIIPDIDIK